MTVRRLLPFVVLAGAIALCATLFRPHWNDANTLRPFDYMQYWSAGRAVLTGQNPYDGRVLYEYQTQIGTNWDDPVMMWNPPWVLPIAMGLGSVDWRTGQLSWFVINLAAVLGSAILLWRYFGGPQYKTWIAALVALGFAPTLFLLLLGQISGLLLLGVVGFAVALKSERYLLAGVCLALTAIKPHLLAPLAMILALEAGKGGKLWRSLAVGVFVLLVCGLVPLAWNPEVWNQYRSSTSNPTPGTNFTIHDWVHPTLGYLVKQSLPGEPFAGMFLPLAIALPAVAVYWWLRRKDWNWTVELPRLVLVSLIAAPYGAWAFDLVLLLVPVVQGAVWLAVAERATLQFKAVAVYAALNLILLTTLAKPESMTNYWITPLVLGGYLLVSVLLNRRREPTGLTRERGELAHV
jgi:hypothetical protein